MNICDLLPKRFENPQVFLVGTKSNRLPDRDGIYAFVQNDVVLYVGYSTNIRYRLSGHPTLNKYEILAGTIYVWPDKHPADEVVAMVCLKPRYNKCISRNIRGFEGKDFWDEVVTVMKQHSNK